MVPLFGFKYVADVVKRKVNSLRVLIVWTKNVRCPLSSLWKISLEKNFGSSTILFHKS